MSPTRLLARRPATLALLLLLFPGFAPLGAAEPAPPVEFQLRPFHWSGPATAAGIVAENPYGDIRIRKASQDEFRISAQIQEIRAEGAELDVVVETLAQRVMVHVACRVSPGQAARDPRGGSPQQPAAGLMAAPATTDESATADPVSATLPCPDALVSRADLALLLPAGKGVRAETVSHRIEARGIAGALNVTTRSGAIDLELGDGPLSARSESGPIRLRVWRETWNHRGRLVSASGDIHVALAPSARMVVAARSVAPWEILLQHGTVARIVQSMDGFTLTTGAPADAVPPAAEAAAGPAPGRLEVVSGAGRIHFSDLPRAQD